MKRFLAPPARCTAQEEAALGFHERHAGAEAQADAGGQGGRVTTAHSYASDFNRVVSKGTPQTQVFCAHIVDYFQDYTILVRPACFMCTCKMPVVHATRPSTPPPLLPGCPPGWLAGMATQARRSNVLRVEWEH